MKEPTLVWALWISLGALASLIGFGIRAIMTGQLVPKSTLDRAYAESDKWEKAWHTSQETLRETVQQGMADFADRLEANTQGMSLLERMVVALASKGPTQ